MYRVLIFSQEYPPFNWGGVTPFTVNLVNGLKAYGIDVQLVTIGKKEEQYVQSNGVKIYRLVANGIYRDELIETDEGVKRHFSFLKKVRNLYQNRERPDCVILADGLCYPEAKSTAIEFGIPLITMVNQIFADIAHLWDGKLDQMVKLEQLYFKNSDHLVVGSRYMHRRMVSLGYEHKTSHIYYGWGYNEWQPNQNDFKETESTNRFVFVGRMVPEKGILTLLKAYASAFEQIENPHLLLVGDGPVKPLAEAFLKTNKLEDHITFTGSLPWNVIPKAFQWATCSIVPSYNEPFGYVALEAIMYGCLPLVSNVGGLAEIAESVPYDNLIPVNMSENFISIPDVEALGNKLIEVSRIPLEQHKEIVLKARTDASKRFNYLTKSSEWIDLITFTMNKEAFVKTTI